MAQETLTGGPPKPGDVIDQFRSRHKRYEAMLKRSEDLQVLRDHLTTMAPDDVVILRLETTYVDDGWSVRTLVYAEAALLAVNRDIEAIKPELKRCAAAVQAMAPRDQ